MTIITANIRPTHIDTGVKGSCGKCPASLAIDEALPGLTWVGVGIFEIVIRRGEKVTTLRTPLRVRNLSLIHISEPTRPY